MLLDMERTTDLWLFGTQHTAENSLTSTVRLFELPESASVAHSRLLSCTACMAHGTPAHHRMDGHTLYVANNSLSFTERLALKFPFLSASEISVQTSAPPKNRYRRTEVSGVDFGIAMSFIGGHRC